MLFKLSGRRVAENVRGVKSSFPQALHARYDRKDILASSKRADLSSSRRGCSDFVTGSAELLCSSLGRLVPGLCHEWRG